MPFPGNYRTLLTPSPALAVLIVYRLLLLKEAPSSEQAVVVPTSAFIPLSPVYVPLDAAAPVVELIANSPVNVVPNRLPALSKPMSVKGCPVLWTDPGTTLCVATSTCPIFWFWSLIHRIGAAWAAAAPMSIEIAPAADSRAAMLIALIFGFLLSRIPRMKWR